MTFGVILTHYLDSLRGRSSERVARQIARQFFEPWYPRPAEDLTTREVFQLKQDNFHRKAHITKAIGILKAAYRQAALLDGYHGINPAMGITGYPKLKRRRRMQPWEWDAIQAILYEGDPRWRGYVLMVYVVDCRPGEALAARPEDMDLHGCIWRKPHTKPGCPHETTLPVQVAAVLMALEPINGRYFPWHESSARKKWVETRRKAGVIGLTLHDLRRSCASELTDSGAPLSLVSDQLGHTSLTATQHYVVPSLEPRRKAIQEHANEVLGGQLPLAILGV